MFTTKCNKSQASIINVNSFLLNADANLCSCVNNGIVPNQLESSETFPAGVCFTDTCSEKQRNVMGIINDNDCIKYCDNVYQWISNDCGTQPCSTKPENVSTPRLNKICRETFDSYKVDKFNKKVAILTGIISLILIVIVYLFLKIRKANVILFINVISFKG